MIKQERYVFFTNDNLKKFVENFLEIGEEFYLISPFNIGSYTGGKWVYLCFTNKRIMEFLIQTDSLNKFNVEYIEENLEEIKNIVDSVSVKSYVNSEIENFETISDNFSTLVKFVYKSKEFKFLHMESPEILMKSLEEYKTFNPH